MTGTVKTMVFHGYKTNQQNRHQFYSFCSRDKDTKQSPSRPNNGEVHRWNITYDEALVSIQHSFPCICNLVIACNRVVIGLSAKDSRNTTNFKMKSSIIPHCEIQVSLVEKTHRGLLQPPFSHLITCPNTQYQNHLFPAVWKSSHSSYLGPDPNYNS